MHKASLVLGAALAAGTASAGEDTDTLIKKLGSGNYPTREIAQKALAKQTDEASIKKMLQAAESTKDAEVLRRIDIILKPYREEEKVRILAERMKGIRDSLGGSFPFIDTARCIHWNTQNQYMSQAKGSMNAPRWEKYRHATEIMIGDLLKDGQKLDELIENMKEGELRWLEDYNSYSKVKLPLTWPRAVKKEAPKK